MSRDKKRAMSEQGKARATENRSDVVRKRHNHSNAADGSNLVLMSQRFLPPLI
jgi:hypothetical protein